MGHAGRHGMRAKERSVITWHRHGNSSGEWLQTERTPVTEPEAKRESSIPMRVRLMSQNYEIQRMLWKIMLQCTRRGHVRVLYILNNFSTEYTQ